MGQGEEDSHNGISKYVTFDKFVEFSKYLDVYQLIESDYPDPERIDGMTCFLILFPSQHAQHGVPNCAGLHMRKF